MVGKAKPPGTISAKDVSKELRALASSERAEASAWFFKTGPGQYGEGDKFLGVSVPIQRRIAKHYHQLPLKEIKKLIASSWHEERLTALFILVYAYKKADASGKKAIYDFYMSHTSNINNWDLVDSSAAYIVGDFLDGHPEKMRILTKMARSNILWERRIAIISCLHFIMRESSKEALVIIDILIDDSHGLIQKAVGWMLREIGKRVSRLTLKSYLDGHAATMPRTTLRYALEHLSKEEKTHYMRLKYSPWIIEVYNQVNN